MRVHAAGGLHGHLTEGERGGERDNMQDTLTSWPHMKYIPLNSFLSLTFIPGTLYSPPLTGQVRGREEGVLNN